MNNLELPNFFVDNSTTSPDIFIHYFKSNSFSNKAKIKLNANLISFVLDGSKELFYENKSQIIENSQFVLAKSGNCLMTEKLSKNNEYSSLLFFFDENYTVDFFKKYSDLLDLDNTKAKTYNSFFVLNYDNFTAEFVRSLQVLLHTDLTITSNFLKLKLEEFLLYLVQKYGASVIEIFNPQSTLKQFAKMQKVVENNIFQNYL